MRTATTMTVWAILEINTSKRKKIMGGADEYRHYEIFRTKRDALREIEDNEYLSKEDVVKIEITIPPKKERGA